MIRRLILAAMLLGIAGCTTYGTPYHGGDYGYYDGYGYDRDYYRDEYDRYDGYGAYPHDYDDYYSYGYGSYGYGYSPWGLGRYSCGWYYGCTGHGGFSITIGYGYGAPWGWYGGGYYPYYAYPYYAYPYYYYPYHGYGWHHPHWPHDDDDDRDEDRGRPDHKPLYEEVAGPGVRSAPGEYLRPTGSSYRGGPRPGGVSPAPVSGPSTPMAKPQPGVRPPARDASLGRRLREPSEQPGVARPYPYESRSMAPQAQRPRHAEPRDVPSRPQPQPRVESPHRYETSRPQPQPRYETSQPRYEARPARPQPRYETPDNPPRVEASRPQPQPRFESSPSAPRASVERPAVRESRSASQNSDRDDER